MSESPKDYKTMLKGELLGVARRLGLTNLSRLRKAEIVDLIRRATRQTAERKAGKQAATKASSGSSARSKTVSTNKAKQTSGKSSGTKKASVRTKLAASKKTASRKTASKKTASKSAASKKTATAASAKKASATEASSTKVKATSKAGAGTTRARSRKVEPQDVAGGRRDRADSSTAGPKRVRSYRRKVVLASSKAPTRTAAQDYEPAELAGLDRDLPRLPETQADNRIVLLPRDPAWLFTYWNLTAEYKEAARAAGGQVLALRLHDVTGVEFDGVNALGTCEHECAEWARSWYVPVPAPGRDYLVEIGYRGGGDWFPLARSQQVTAPADQPSTWVQEESVTIDFDEDLRAARNRLPQMQAPTEPPTALPLTMQTIFDDGELRIVAGGQGLNPSGMPHWPPASQLLAGPGGVPGSLPQLPGSLGHLPGSQGQLPGSLGHLPGSQGHLPGSQGHLPGSLGLLGHLARHPGTGEGGALGLGPDGRVFAGQPLMLEQGEQPMLQAAVELVISGRSYPGAELTVAGQRVPTGPDGAFSLRVSVPDGLRDLPIEAHSVETGASRRLVVRLGRELER